jgi:hypothetical protein
MKRLLGILAVTGLLLGMGSILWVVASPADLDESGVDRLRLISEDTGLIASEQALSPACRYDAGYQVYLCPETQAVTLAPRDPAAAARAKVLLNSTGLLLIPDSTADRVMAFDPTTGNLVDADFVPADPTHLATPIHAILSAGRDSILVSDQINDVVQEYDLDGNYMGTFAPAGGPNPAILDNIRGIALRPNGNLLVTVASGTNDDSVAEFDTSGNYLGNFVANASGGLGSPFDVYGRSADWLVAGIDSDAIHRYDLTGAYLDNLTAINTFPEQLAEAGNGNVLVANFSGTQEGIVEFTAAGALVAIYNPATVGGYRGVYELPNGNILTTNGTGVYEIDRAGNVVDTKITGTSARFIDYLPPAGPDLSLTKAVIPDGAIPGETVQYVIEFAYTGVPTATVTGVVITDEVPIYLVGVQIANSGADITATGTISYVWQVAELAPGEGGVITLTGQISMGLAAGFAFTNTAVISSPLAEGNTDNNVGEARFVVHNAPPIAEDDTATTPEGQAVVIPVMDNDHDANNDPMHIESMSGPISGTVGMDGVTVTYTPTLGFAGVDVFDYTIADPGGLTGTATVSVTVTPVNSSPTISEIADQTIYENTSTGPISFTVYDEETSADDLLLWGASSDTALLPVSHIVFGGSGMTRTVTLTPTADMTGTCTITLTVDDGTDTADEKFELKVLPRLLFRVYLPLVVRAEP